LHYILANNTLAKNYYGKPAASLGRIPAKAGIYPVDEEAVRQQGDSNPASFHSDGSRNPEAVRQQGDSMF